MATMTFSTLTQDLKDWMENDGTEFSNETANFISLADSFLEARQNIIENIKILNWQDGFYRKDIGYKVIDE